MSCEHTSSLTEIAEAVCVYRPSCPRLCRTFLGQEKLHPESRRVAEDSENNAVEMGDTDKVSKRKLQKITRMLSQIIDAERC